MDNNNFHKLVNNSFLFRLYLLKSLPMAYIAGVRVKELNSERCATTIKFKWLTQNPFRSMYFACEAMAAEMSTALLVLPFVYKASPAISMLIVENKATFYKKAIGKITFTCTDGNHISQKIALAKQTKEPVSIDISSIGTDEEGDKVAEFIFTWSVKIKSI